MSHVPPPPAAKDTPEWVQWQLKYAFSPDDAALIEWLATWQCLFDREMEHRECASIRGWQKWQADLAWEVIRTIVKDRPDFDIPF